MDRRLNLVQERRTGSQELVRHMLEERNRLLSLLLQVSSDNTDEYSIQCDLEEFVQVLVDYIAAGHFGLYERISEGKERRKTIFELAVEIYPYIDKTTKIALAFDEKYNANSGSVNSVDLQSDLSTLGEALTTRIEMEDRLISRMIEPIPN